MPSLLIFRRLSLALVLVSIILGGCQAPKSKPIPELALQIRSAINSNDVEEFQSLIALPLFISEQTWESAKDGSGFVLGERHDQIIDGDATTEKLAVFIQSVTIVGDEAMVDGLTHGLFSEELGGQAGYWEKLDLVLFKRGEGDVEHIVLLGFDSQTKQLKAIYLN